MPSKTSSPTAFSYIRFSSAKQAEGDSLRRQSELATEYCRRRGWTLDTALNLRDLAVSAYTGENALTGNLGVFLEAINRGTVQPGSVLIVESFDRISRQGIDEGYEIVKRILKAGVRIVTLSPEREFDLEATKSLSKGALEIQLILERAAEESDRKSVRLSHVWVQKRRDASNRVVMTNALPAWVQCRDGELSLIPDAAAAIRRIFDLSVNGYGITNIIRALHRERIPPLGDSKRWSRTYIALILSDRRVIGACQPRRERKNVGKEIPNYFPAVMSENEWLQARASIRRRSVCKGRTGSSDAVNLFAGLLRNARPPHDSFVMSARSTVRRNGERARKVGILLNSGTTTGAKSYSIPYLQFEDAFLDWFKEVKAGDVLPGNGPNDDAAKLAGSLEKVETELADAAADMDKNGYSKMLADHSRKLESRQRELAADLAEIRRRAAHPLGESFGTALTLADHLKRSDDPRDTRLRLRSALRSVIEEMQILIVRHSFHLLAAVQVVFVGGDFRLFVIHHKQAGNRRKEWCQSGSFTADEVESIDLRKPKDVVKLEKFMLPRISGA